MRKEYANILTQDQCDSIANSMIRLKNINALDCEDNNYFYNNSLGIMNLPETLELVDYVDSIVRPDNPEIRFENSYTRIYQNNSFLKIHTDRPELFLTLTICVYSDIDHDWPLHVSNVTHQGVWSINGPIEQYTSNFSSYSTPVGSGITCDGLKYPHWRDPLLCQPNQMVIQTFYHWNRAWLPRSANF